MAKQHIRTEAEQEPARSSASKGRATPSRREQEAARRHPLVAADRTEARRASREAGRAERERAQAGLAAGDERYLPVRDKGPQKRFVRDWVDARWSVGEALIPVMGLVIVSTMLPSYFQVWGMFVLYGFFLLAVLDALLLGQRLTRRLRARYGDRAERVRWYAAMRSFQLRPMRMPKPQRRRGDFPTL
ncbi:MAG: DUF3043 domain-containing protein [Microbacteriaceae bacterium]